MRIRVSVHAVVVAAASMFLARPATAQGPYPVGGRVQASPLQMEGYWQECTVVSGPDAYQSYRLKCNKLEMSVPGKWIRPAGTSGLKPPPPAPTGEPQAPRPAKPQATPVVLEEAPRPSTTAPPTKSAGGGGGGVALGAYECWAYNTPRLLLNFKVIGPGRYTASDGSAGAFTFDASSKAIRFTGYLANSMPAGFTSIYHEPHGKPTVSFRGRSGFEASFCERAK